ncbi:hypothetical protein AC95_2105 [Escherichia coli 2-052-05_S4_C2]|nr:hypothetical protein AC95_2105 [Escherichia coli 2-052-05_S4_C2]
MIVRKLAVIFIGHYQKQLNYLNIFYHIMKDKMVNTMLTSNYH